MNIDPEPLPRIPRPLPGLFGWFCCGPIPAGIPAPGRDILALGGPIPAGRKFMGLLGLWKGGYPPYG